jgi:hypothetical protein
MRVFFPAAASGSGERRLLLRDERASFTDGARSGAYWTIPRPRSRMLNQGKVADSQLWGARDGELSISTLPLQKLPPIRHQAVTDQCWAISKIRCWKSRFFKD